MTDRIAESVEIERPEIQQRKQCQRSQGSLASNATCETKVIDLDLYLTLEVGASRIHGATKPSAALGFGVTYDFSGDPYPAALNHVEISLGPQINKAISVPFYWSVALGISKTFGCGCDSWP
jgi:hypothetical protein